MSDKKMNYYDAKALIESAHKMTGNDDFKLLQKYMLLLYRIQQEALIVLAPFPDRSLSGYDSKSLDERVRERMECTKRLIDRVKEAS